MEPPATRRPPAATRAAAVATMLAALALLAGCGRSSGPAEVRPAAIRPQVLGQVITRDAEAVAPPTGQVEQPGAAGADGAGSAATGIPSPSTAAPVAPVATTATTATPAPAAPRATVPSAPTGVTVAAGPGSVTVAFDEDPAATSYTVRASNGSSVTGPASPLTVRGLLADTDYTFTVVASNALGTSAPSGPTASVTPTGPVTNTAPLAPGRLLVNQSVSFVSTPGTLVSRRPQATERPATSLFDPPSAGLPAGLEWRVLFLRARNCEAGPRRIEFFVVDERAGATVRKFVQNDAWVTGQPNRPVAVEVAAEAALAWTDTAASPVIVGPGQSLGARWYGMEGGAEACNWQLTAVQQPAGTGAGTGLTTGATASPGGSFRAGRAGMRTSWQTVPEGTFWVPGTVTATNCEGGERQMEVMLLGPGGITMGALTPAADGAGPVGVPAGGTFTWSAEAAGHPLVVLPAGWSLGVRWLGMAGDRPDATCGWSATVSAGAPGA